MSNSFSLESARHQPSLVDFWMPCGREVGLREVGRREERVFISGFAFLVIFLYFSIFLWLALLQILFTVNVRSL